MDQDFGECGLEILMRFLQVFRAATVCVCLGGLGKSGQGLLTLFVVGQLHDGPMNNLLHNFELTANILICHLELQGQLGEEKLRLATGPVEALFEKHFGLCPLASTLASQAGEHTVIVMGSQF